MFIILLFLGILIGLNLIPQLFKKELPQTEKLIKRVVLLGALIFIGLITTSALGLRLKGSYTIQIITTLVLISVLAYFAVVKNSWHKFISVLLMIPLILLCLYFQIFIKHIDSFQVDENLKYTVHQEGFLGCGEVIRLTESKFLIFDKELIHIPNLCLLGIDKIETIEIKPNKIKLLIYHNGEMDSENPFYYEFEY